MADIEDSARTLAEKHVEHYRSCGCLGDSAVCCDPRCECHDEAKDSDSPKAPGPRLLCGCCGQRVTERIPDPWEGRLDGFCERCALIRCDAYPGACR